MSSASLPLKYSFFLMCAALCAQNDVIVARL